ncbi:MAG TPA: peroxiredoxin [Candidatus Sulfotelmatobacter sp.]|nr:peroxiredoxin [Candidatus Sulfotelmatobacter sp.]
MKRLWISLMALMAAGVARADEPALKVGDAAPDFSLPYATRDSIAGDKLTLSSFAGKSNVVVAFYPADWSGGCTKEVCTLRDNFSMLGALNADVIAMSGDYIFSHHEWAKYHNLPFRLASDHDHAVAKKYGSYMAEYGYNKRTVFLVDKKGKIAYIDMTYSPRDSVSFMKLEGAIKALK